MTSTRDGRATSSARDIRADGRYGQWAVLRPDAGREPNNPTIRVCLCRCDCGTVARVRAAQLATGRSRRCKACSYKARRPHLDIMPDAAVRGKWAACHSNMLRRVTDPGCDHYHLYGGRGITVCAEWQDGCRAFLEFIAAVPEHTDLTLTLDRVDPDGPYSPGNCRLASRKAQQRNRRVSRVVEFAGALRLSCYRAPPSNP